MGYSYFYLNGNHDTQADMNSQEIVANDIRYGKNVSLTQMGPANITGASNYYIPVLKSGSNGVDFNDTAYSLWIFDSNSEDCEGVPGYGCVEDDAIQWYVDTASSLQESLNTRVLPPALAFFHIPINEYLVTPGSTGSGTCYGTKDESICCSSVNTGLFTAFLDVGDVR